MFLRGDGWRKRPPGLKPARERIVFRGLKAPAPSEVCAFPGLRTETWGTLGRVD
jgi:hypothetical protein